MATHTHSTESARRDDSSVSTRRTAQSPTETSLTEEQLRNSSGVAAERLYAGGPPPSANSVLQMQRSIGNQAVARRLAQSPVPVRTVQRKDAAHGPSVKAAPGVSQQIGTPRAAESVSGARQILPPAQTDAESIQRKAVANVTAVGLFRDVGNGLFGSDTPVNANDVLALVRAIRTSDEASGERTNIKIITGTHGTAAGHLVGEPVFYKEDLANEGHKGGGGWVNVHNVRNQTKAQVAAWKNSQSNFAVIMAWCYSAQTEANWDIVNATWEKGSDGKNVWAW